MAKKKKKRAGKTGVKKKKKSALSKLMEELVRDYEPPTEDVFRAMGNRWVHVHLRLLNWSYMNFDLKISESTPLYIVQQKIMERHSGSVKALTMWKDGVAPNLKLKDMHKTLRDIFHFDSSMAYVPPEEKTKQEEREDEDDEGEIQTDVESKAKRVDEEGKEETRDEENDENEDMDDGDDEVVDVADDDSDEEEEGDEEAVNEKETDAHISYTDIEYECVIYYDFEPYESDCPLLLVEPRLLSVLNSEKI